jgi:hypothetical protein
VLKLVEQFSSNVAGAPDLDWTAYQLFHEKSWKVHSLTCESLYNRYVKVIFFFFFWIGYVNMYYDIYTLVVRSRLGFHS